MKIQINRKELAKHIFIVQRAISTRTTMQILEGILIKASNNKINLTATDTEISIITKTSAIVEEEGSVIVNGRLFGNIIRKLTNDTIKISVDNNTMNLKCGNSEFNISVQKAEGYPSLPTIKKDKYFTLSSEELKAAIRKTSFAVSLNETRMIFTGVNMDFRGDCINFVALDGFRMAIMKIKKDTSFNSQATIPARSFIELEKIIEAGDNDIVIYLEDNFIVFEFESTTFYSTLIAGNFFDYENLLKDSYKIETTVKKNDLQLSVERASLLAREDKANLVEIKLNDKTISIDSNTEIGNVHEIIECSPIASSLRIAFNSKYLLEGIKIMETENVILHFTDFVNPCVIKEDNNDNYIYLVLPVRLAQ